MIKNHLQLSESDREHLHKLVAQDKLAVKVYRRARALLCLDGGTSWQSAATLVEVDYNCVARWRDRYNSQGLEALYDRPRSGRPPHIGGTERAKITALACSTPPQGHAKWSVRLLQHKAVELGYVETISPDTVHQMLKKHAPAAPAQDLVHWSDHQGVYRAHGSHPSSLLFALRCPLSCGVLR